TKYIDIEVVTAILAHMWNLSINVVYPSEGSIPYYHPGTDPDVVLVCNERKQPDLYFCSTKPKTDRWRPIKGKDWTNKINVLTNVTAAHSLAEKKLRVRSVNKVVEEFNTVTIQINQMKETLALYRDQMESMKQKIDTWSANVNKMEGKQGVLRLRLMELGVDVTKLTKSGHVVEGVHYTEKSTAFPAPSSTVSKPTSEQDDLGIPVSGEQTGSNVNVEVHPTPAISDALTIFQPVSTSTSTVVTAGQSNIVPPVSTVVTAGASSSSGTVSTVSAMGQIVPLNAAQISQLITPGSSAVGGAQQILNIGGQNILVSGSGPGTVGSASIRYGKILKGIHKYFCSKCQRPFTQKESLTRHEQENCPAIPKEQKKK
ncbi:MAG: hypothetical protein MJE68_00525, partial [Proteobacteria bacterium]|nr:hypothetical protein [Pseudomonadota bacterium]